MTPCDAAAWDMLSTGVNNNTMAFLIVIGHINSLSPGMTYHLHIYRPGLHLTVIAAVDMNTEHGLSIGLSNVFCFVNNVNWITEAWVTPPLCVVQWTGPDYNKHSCEGSGI